MGGLKIQLFGEGLFENIINIKNPNNIKNM